MRDRTARSTLIVSGLLATLAFSGAVHASDPGKFLYVDPPTGKTIPVFCYPGATKCDRQILFIMHGHQRDAEDYLQTWVEKFKRKDGFLLVAPQFGEKDFENEFGYQTGNVRSKDGEQIPKSAWTFMILERLFDDLKARFGSRYPTYKIYGHSAGAQFTHRLFLLLPEARLDTAYAANPGWWTFPDLSIDFPYGLKGISYSEETLAKQFGKHLVILLGDQDVNTGDPLLRHTLEADRQGDDRFERGRNFFDAARRKAMALHARFGWELAVIRGAGHSNADVATVMHKYMAR